MGLLPAIISGLLSTGTIITNKLVGLLQQHTLCADFQDCINPLGTLPQGFWGQCRWSWVVWVDRSQAKGGAEVPLQPAVLPGTWPGSCQDVAWHGQTRGHSAALVTVFQEETVDVVPNAGQMQKELPTDEWQQEEEAFGLLTLWLTHL